MLRSERFKKLKHITETYGPQFAFIAPVTYLYKIPQQSRFHLLLAHLLTNDNYVDFYKKRQAQGDFILLDNSAFEFGAPIESDRMRELVDTSGLVPDAIVAPDYPGEPYEKTIESFNLFQPKWPDTLIMAVPQSVENDYEGWLKCYRYFINNEHAAMVGMSILGIPTAFKQLVGTDDIATNRLFATALIRREGYDISEDPRIDTHHHYLGLGLPRELLIQAQLGLMDTMDSSSPIWHGVQQIAYDDSPGGLVNGKSRVRVNFDHIEQDAQYSPPEINRNIKQILHFLKPQQ